MAVQNIVELLFKVSDQASGPSKAIAGSMDSVKSAALAATAAAAAVGGGLLFAAKKAVDLGTKFEDTSLSIAGALTAFNLAPNIELAEKAAVKALGNIDKMAAKLPGTTEDYVEVFKSGLPAAIAAGTTDLDKIADFTSRYTAVATANMVDAQQAGSDLSLMLTGMAGQQVAMFRKLQPLIGKTAEEFNKMTRAARMAAIDKSLAGYTGMLARAGDTMSSKLGEAEAHIAKITRLAGGPIFDAMLAQLAKVNDYFTKNEQSVIAIGSQLANTVVNGIKLIIDNFDTLLSIAKNLLEVWVAFKVGVVATEITAGLFAIAGAFNAITVSAGEAAAAEAAATGGLSALVGVAVGLTALAGMKFIEGKTKRALVQPQAAQIAPMDFPARQQFAQILQREDDLSRQLYGATRFTELLPDLQQEVLRKIGETHPAAAAPFREAFAQHVKDLGVALEDVIPTAKFGKPGLPGGPKKADVIIENARFDIKQAFAEGYDPDRIAAAFVESIGSTALYPGQSGFAAAGTGA